MTTNPSLTSKIAALPYTPGVYLMKDAEGNILYIGKALSLRKRVQSYLRPQADMPKIGILMGRVQDIDHIQTPTEVDALLLESRLVHQYQPQFNKELKDGKSFPLLKITSDAFPRILITRLPAKRRRSSSFPPTADPLLRRSNGLASQRRASDDLVAERPAGNKSDKLAAAGKKAIFYGPYTDAKLLREAIALINALFPLRKCRKLPKRACLYYHIGQCLAPCIKPEIKDEYERVVEEVRSFLGSGKRSFMEYLTARMEEAAEEYRYEDAQYFKEQIEALGKLRKKKFFPATGDVSVSLSATLELKKYLGMDKLPEKIVCFDVSNIQGDEAVASKVSFYRELPDKIEYRRYKIKTVAGINDYAMIQEALQRMLTGIKEGRETFIPDIIMIDGGKGHLQAAKQILDQEQFENTVLISIAKKFETIYLSQNPSPSPQGHVYRHCERPGGAKQSQRLLRHFVPRNDTKQPPPCRGEGRVRGNLNSLLVDFPKDSSALYLLQKIRDEAHRFAITYHRSLKEKGLRRSELDLIPGIGTARKRILLEQFDSIEELKRAGVEQLAGLPGMNRLAAVTVWNYFHDQHRA